MTEIFSFTLWQGMVLNQVKDYRRRSQLPLEGGGRYGIGGRRGDTSVTARGCCAGNQSNSRDLAQHAGLVARRYVCWSGFRN